jgi:hypothetical protein
MEIINPCNLQDLKKFYCSFNNSNILNLNNVQDRKKYIECLPLKITTRLKQNSSVVGCKIYKPGDSGYLRIKLFDHEKVINEGHFYPKLINHVIVVCMFVRGDKKIDRMTLSIDEFLMMCKTQVVPEGKTLTLISDHMDVQSIEWDYGQVS